MIRTALAVLAGSVAPVVAEPFSLQMPVDCTLGETCYIQQYVDHDPGPGARDFTCGGLSYDEHQGTDFALPTQEAMARGVTVRAAAPGTVRGLRDGVPDRLYSGEDLDGQDCGNGIALSHADGWETQYCHLRAGSLRVSLGQRLEAGALLGEIGLSGRTQFPHLHLTVRHDGKVVDPFAPDGGDTCDSARTLWSDPLAYVPGGLFDIGFAPAVPDFDDVKSGAADDHPPTRDSAIVGYGHAFGVRAGDLVEIAIAGPGGTLLHHRETMQKPQASAFRAAGRKAPLEGWPAGDYRLTVRLLRDGEMLGERSRSLSLP